MNRFLNECLCDIYIAGTCLTLAQLLPTTCDEATKGENSVVEVKDSNCWGHRGQNSLIKLQGTVRYYI